MAVLTLAACSKDEVIQQNPNDEITFSVVTNKAVSRAADGYCNNSTPAEMKVSALYTDGTAPITWKPYFTNDTYEKKDNSDKAEKDYVIKGGVNRYWPDLGETEDGVKMKFFAMVNATPTWDGTGANVTMKTDFTVKSAVKDQVDVLYAVQEVTKRPSTGVQALNFRHALSQIEFKATNKNSKIYVKITGVKVMNVKNQGTFTLPVTSTTTPYVATGTGHTTLPTDETIASQGEWTDKTGAAQYEIATLKDDESVEETKLLPGNSSVVSLTATDPTGKEYNNNTLYLLPQTFGDGTGETTKLWNGTALLMNEGKTAYETNTGAYLILTCQIFNVANPNSSDPNGGYVSSDVAVWGTASEAKDIAVKLPNTEWKQGKRYVYTFTFTTDGNGGYDPKDNTPVLTPITLSVTVDDFVKGIDKDVDMTTEP